MAELDIKYPILALAATGTHVTNPYHNLVHCYNVYKTCEVLLEYYNEKPSTELMWASLFHDYNHSGGERDDHYNIQQAIDGVKSKIAEFYLTYPEYPKVDINKIISLINCTKYIGHFPNEPETLEEQCLRDADIMTVFSSHNVAINLLNGLYTELNRDGTMSKSDFFNKTHEFLSNSTVYTGLAKLHFRHLDITMLELKLEFLHYG